MKRPLARVDRATAARRLKWAGLAMRAGGGLIALGSVLPWAWLPLAGVRLPLPGVLGWGALTLLLGVWLFRRAPWWAALLSSMVSIAAALEVRATLPAAINRALLGMELRLQPMNNLLARFGIAPLDIFDFATPWDRLRGPGVPVVVLGGLLALAGALVTAASLLGAYDLRRCIACGHRNRPTRVTAFCVRCGEPMPMERTCAECHTLAEPGDLCCGVCGSALPR